MITQPETRTETHEALSIGDVRIEFRDRRRAWEFALEDPHAAFLVEDNAPADISLTIRKGQPASPAAETCLYTTEGGLWNLYREKGSLVFTLGAPAEGGAIHRMARVDDAVTRGDVFITPAGDRPAFHPYPLRYPLDELLIINHLARGRGAVIHACGVITAGGEGCLFVGRSGAGKSTMSGLWEGRPGVTILSDDRVILRPAGEGFRMYGTPWHGDAAVCSPASAPLKRVFLLEHASENRATPAGEAAAVENLLVNCFAPFYDAAGMSWTLALIASLVDRVPVDHLQFLPLPSTIDYLLSRKAA